MDLGQVVISALGKNFLHLSTLQAVKLKCCNVNGPLLSVHSNLMCLWGLYKGGVIFVFLQWDMGRIWNSGASETCVFLLCWATEAQKPKTFYLIEFSFGNLLN